MRKPFFSSRVRIGLLSARSSAVSLVTPSASAASIMFSTIAFPMPWPWAESRTRKATSASSILRGSIFSLKDEPEG